MILILILILLRQENIHRHSSGYDTPLRCSSMAGTSARCSLHAPRRRHRERVQSKGSRWLLSLQSKQARCWGEFRYLFYEHSLQHLTGPVLILLMATECNRVWSDTNLFGLLLEPRLQGADDCPKFEWAAILFCTEARHALGSLLVRCQERECLVTEFGDLNIFA